MTAAAGDSPSTGGDLTASAAVLLGLLDQSGPQTTYDLNATIEVMIGHYWAFPTSQLYAEAKRLERAELVRVEQEEFGRRRKVLHITDEGRGALHQWLHGSTDHVTEIRDVGLLKLFFSDSVDDSQVVELAYQRLAHHQAKLALYLQYEQALCARDGAASETKWADRPLQLGISYERMVVAFWEQVAAEAAATDSR